MQEDHVNSHDKTDASIDKDSSDKTKEDPKHSNDKTPSVEDSNKAAPPSSLEQLSAITDDTRTYVSEFMSGLAGTESTDELFDIGLVISQINVGIWESVRNYIIFIFYVPRIISILSCTRGNNYTVELVLICFTREFTHVS